ncbi:MAG TPA: methyltransferase domain-containing protein [Deltaproteobacteria bacterium]|nr:methyltransferase domain-containing protein [Deltaproteobacteria bacterium]
MKALDRFLQRWRIRMATPHVREGDRLLDIGCFDRSLIDRVLPRIASAVGIDAHLASPEKTDDRVELLRGEFPGNVRFGDACFDAITLLAVLEHVDDPGLLARECERILAPGGRVIVTVPHPLVDVALDVLMFVGLADGMAAEEHHGFDVRETRRIFEAAGLRLQHQRRFQLGLNRLYVFEKPLDAG